jgi:23S rRNA (guanine2535-N1)-methyltransferase
MGRDDGGGLADSISARQHFSLKLKNRGAGTHGLPFFLGECCMKFEFNASKENYEHLAAGRVILSQVGMTSFPVRLASEIFQLCHAYLAKPTLRLYDPCCGTAYLLTTLGFLHHEAIEGIYASDIGFDSLQVAKKNLVLLNKEGLETRRKEIQRLYEAYGKGSHAEALESCESLLKRLPQKELAKDVWLADATETSLAPRSVDLLICDLPYGEKVAWESSSDKPLYELLERQHSVLAEPALAVIISDKGQKAAHPLYRRYKQLVHGKRRISILEAQ